QQSIRLSRLFILAGMLLVAGCSMVGRKSYNPAPVPSHGPKIEGYGPIVFGTPRDEAFRVLQGKGRFEPVNNGKATALVYMDYMDYMLVRVEQYFDDKNKAARAEVYVADAMNTPKSLQECR